MCSHDKRPSSIYAKICKKISSFQNDDRVCRGNFFFAVRLFAVDSINKRANGFIIAIVFATKSFFFRFVRSSFQLSNEAALNIFIFCYIIHRIERSRMQETEGQRNNKKKIEYTQFMQLGLAQRFNDLTKPIQFVSNTFNYSN